MGSAKGLSAPTSSFAREEASFQAQDDLRTLSRAEEIRSDAGRMRHVGRHLRKQQKLLKRVSLSRAPGGRR